jgi:tetratricopeptide (TPR) repeat protein
MTGVLASLYRAIYEIGPKTQKKKLETYLKTHPGDPDVVFTLGLIKKRWGSLEEANRYYTALLNRNPSAGIVINNLSNVFFAQGKLEQSEAAYKSAIRTDNNRASVNNNLYRTYIELYKFLEARKEKSSLLPASSTLI